MLTEPQVQVDFNADRTTTLRIVGEISTATLSAVRDTINGAIGASGPLIVDLTQVTHLDKAGVGLLFDLAGERSLEIVMGPGCSVYPVVRVSGLCEVALCR